MPYKVLPPRTAEITGRAAFSIAEFCMRNGISFGMFSKIRRRGEGPER